MAPSCAAGQWGGMDRHLLVIDLEATCDRSGFPRDDSEIIEIGAVLVEPTNLKAIDEFQTFVRPFVRPQLTAFCTELTSITQDQVEGAPGFGEAVDALSAWLRVPVIFCSWGAYDRNQFSRDRRRHGLARDRLAWAREHVNLKAAFAERAGKTFGMAGALRRVGLPLVGTHHRGIDDARNIALLLPWCLGRQPLSQRR